MQPPEPEKIWKISASSGNADIKQGGSIPPLIQTILSQRGINTPEEIERFLAPSLEHLPSPQSMLGLKPATCILADALASGSPVLIYGDYDADGVCATALLANFFQEIGLKTICHLPDRIIDGYGLNSETLIRLKQEQGELTEAPEPVLVTVDCGITSLTEVAVAKKLGFKVIITDHHQPGPVLPHADAILNPQQAECPFAFKELAGVGVAFYLAIGLRAELGKKDLWKGKSAPNLKRYLDLVAIGSVADMVSLTGVNRILVKAGLEVINRNPGPGISAMLRTAKLTNGKINTETIGYQLAPRINAAGRIDSAQIALELLCCQSETTAANLAEKLEDINLQRRELTETTQKDALKKAGKQLDNNHAALVLSSRDWHQGIVGLVASRMANNFNRPAVVMAVDEKGMARGSVRSSGNIDIHESLTECRHVLERFGGHKMAAGLTIKEKNIPEFTSIFIKSIARKSVEAELKPLININLKAEIDDLMQERIWHYLKLMEPFGPGNPEPVFCCDDVGMKLVKPRRVGNDSLRFQLRANGKFYNGIGFGQSQWLKMAENQPLQLAYKIYLNDYRGAENWEIRLEDVKTTS